MAQLLLIYVTQKFWGWLYIRSIGPKHLQFAILPATEGKIYTTMQSYRLMLKVLFLNTTSYCFQFVSIASVTFDFLKIKNAQES